MRNTNNPHLSLDELVEYISNRSAKGLERINKSDVGNHLAFALNEIETAIKQEEMSNRLTMWGHRPRVVNLEKIPYTDIISGHIDILNSELNLKKSLSKGVTEWRGPVWDGLEFPRDEAYEMWPLAGADHESTSAEGLNDEPESQQSEDTEASPGVLTTDMQRKGGSRSNYNRGLQEAVERIIDILHGDATPATFSALWDWLLENALKDKPHEFEPVIRGCNYLHFKDGGGDVLHFEDYNGNPYHRAKSSLRRYFTRAMTRPSQSQ